MVISDDNGEFYLTQTVYEHKTEEKGIITTSIYNAESETLYRYVSSDLIAQNSTQIEQDVIYDYIPEYNETNEIGLNDFNWDGTTFVCGITGIAACVSFCWSLEKSGFGTKHLCQVACSAAFIIGCM